MRACAPGDPLPRSGLAECVFADGTSDPSRQARVLHRQPYQGRVEPKVVAHVERQAPGVVLDRKRHVFADICEGDRDAGDYQEDGDGFFQHGLMSTRKNRGASTTTPLTPAAMKTKRENLILVRSRMVPAAAA
jgi:hypothetical protein